MNAISVSEIYCVVEMFLVPLGSVVQKVNSAIHRIVIFQTFSTCSVPEKTHIKVQAFQDKVTLSLVSSIYLVSMLFMPFCCN